jgi:hypothetical protein
MIDLNNHTMVYINTFVVDLKLQHTDGLSVYGLYEISVFMLKLRFCRRPSICGLYIP